MYSQLAIIIPAYKDVFLKQTLDSISAQTCKDFTVYIGDDNSPYHLCNIIDEYRDEIDIVYKRFDSNLGGKDLVAQWERCIALSQYEPYIWLFSDDDVMEPRCVEKFIKLSNEDKDNWLIRFNISRINTDGKCEHQYDNWPVTMTAKQYLDRKLLEHNCVSFVVEFIFSRTLYKKSHGFQNFDLAWGADFITWLKFSGECNGIKTIYGKDCRILWRSSNKNISPNKSKSIILRKIKAVVEYMAYVKSWLITNGYPYSFKYSRYVWGEIKRNRNLINNEDIELLNDRYNKLIGPSFLSRLAFIYVKYLCHK